VYIKTIKIMKTRISKIATVTLFSLTMLVGNVYADKTEASALSNENIERTLEIENWMVNERVWNANNLAATEIETTLEVETEEALKVDNWMINNEIFNMGSAFITEYASVLEVGTEEAMAIEDWMISNQNFNITNIAETKKETGQTLELEFWMTNENTWNK
jgi:hypothetical protein